MICNDNSNTNSNTQNHNNLYRLMGIIDERRRVTDGDFIELGSEGSLHIRVFESAAKRHVSKNDRH